MITTLDRRSRGAASAAAAAFWDVLRAPVNVVLLAAAFGIMALAGFSWGAAALALDVLLVGGAAATPRAQRAALGRRRARARLQGRRRASARVAGLSESQRAQHAELVRLCGEVRAAWGGSGERPLLAGAAEGLDDLCDTFAELLAALNDHRRMIGDRDRRQVERDLAELDAAPPAAPELRPVLDQRRRTLAERLDLFARAEANREAVSHHLAALEDFVRLLRDRAVTADVGAGGEEGGVAGAVARAREILDQVQRFVDAADEIGGRSVALALVVAAALALGGVAGCSRCGRAPAPEAGAELADVIAPDARRVAWAPQPAKLGRAFEEIVARLGNEELKRVREDVARQLGFDPLTEDGLRAAGVDPAGGILIADEGGQGPVLLVARVADAEALKAALRRLAKDRGGAGSEKTAPGSGAAGAAAAVRTTWSREEGGPPELSVALLRGLALVCAGPKCEAAYRVAEQRSAAASLGSSARWKSAREQLGARDLYLMTVRDETDVQPRDTMISGVPEVALGLTLGVPESSLRVFAALPPEDATRLAAALPGGGAALLGRLKPGGPLYLRLGVDGRAAAAWLEASPLGSMIARLREEMKAAGGDLDRDLLSNLRPGVVLSVDLAPNVDLSRAMVFDPRQVNPFQHFTLEAAARVVDPARMRAALKTAAALAPRFGATVEARKPQWKVAGAPGALKARDIMIYQARYALGEGLAWALDGDTLVAGAGREGVIEDLLSRGDAAADPQAFPPLLRAALLAEPGSALALDLEPLTEEIRALPPEAFGTGPTAFSARAMAQNLLDPLSRLRAAVQVRPAEGGAQIDAAIELRGNGL